MTETTTNHGWEIPEVGGSKDVWGQILNDFFDGELDEEVALKGPFSERPIAGGDVSDLYLATDRRIVYYNDGTSWEAVYGLGTEEELVPGTSHFESVHTERISNVADYIVGDGDDLQSVLNGLVEGDVVWVGAGTYDPIGIDTNSVRIDFHPNATVKVPDGATEPAQTLTIAADNVKVNCHGALLDGNRPNLSLGSNPDTREADGIGIYGADVTVSNPHVKQPCGHGIIFWDEDPATHVSTNADGTGQGAREGSHIDGAIIEDNGHPDDQRAALDYAATAGILENCSAENLHIIAGEYTSQCIQHHGASFCHSENFYVESTRSDVPPIVIDEQDASSRQNYVGSLHFVQASTVTTANHLLRPRGTNTTIEDFSYDCADGVVDRAVTGPQNGTTFKNCTFRDEVRIAGGTSKLIACDWEGSGWVQSVGADARAIISDCVFDTDRTGAVIRAFENSAGVKVSSTDISSGEIVNQSGVEDSRFSDIDSDATTIITDSGTRTRWDGVIGGGPIGGVDIGSLTGAQTGDVAVSDGTTGDADALYRLKANGDWQAVHDPTVMVTPA